ncbi:MAG: hypothetical protein AAB386_01435 [Patescibacteria group bacterium]
MKIELTLTRDEEHRVAQNARRFGYDVPRYVRFVIAQEARQMTPRMIQKVRRALKAHSEGKTKTVSSVAELLGERSSA